MTEQLMDSQALQGCVIPSPILQYCLEVTERWRQCGDSDLAILATESGMLVCSPAVAHRGNTEMNNVRQLLQERVENAVVMAYSRAANIRLLLTEADRANGAGKGADNALVNDVTRAQQTLTDLVSEALTMGASDIHLRFTHVQAWIKFRVKGRLVGTQCRSREAMLESIAAALNTYSDDYREVFNEQRSDSASIELQLPATTERSAQQVRLRLQKSPLNHGFSVTLRLLPELPQQALNLQDLSMPVDVRAGIDELLKQRHGLILIVGATGQGKTTTLAAINRLFGEAKKIISLEDPIEIVQDNVEQRWVDGQHDSFAEHIKIALREDPDVISISEIRDTGTAKAAVMAALTGHVVTATLHAHDCIGAIQRLANLGVSVNELIAGGVLQGIIAQHLVHRQDDSVLIAEYVLMDYPARRYLRREDYSGWREHLQQQGWQSMADRWRAQHPALASLHEPNQVYQYSAQGPCAG